MSQNVYHEILSMSARHAGRIMGRNAFKISVSVNHSWSRILREAVVWISMGASQLWEIFCLVNFMIA
jgi:hypothetical protein